jgi:hypothetical protein
MKHFLSVNEVSNLDQLVSNALAYKANPFKDLPLGTTSDWECSS